MMGINKRSVKLLWFLSTLIIVFTIALLIANHSDQWQADKKMKEFFPSMLNIYDENKELLNFMSNFVKDVEEFICYRQSGWWVYSGETEIPFDELPTEVCDAIRALSNNCNPPLVAVEALPDANRFEFYSNDTKFCLCLIHTSEKNAKTKFWDSSYFLKAESIYQINEYWYFSCGIRARG